MRKRISPEWIGLVGISCLLAGCSTVIPKKKATDGADAGNVAPSAAGAASTADTQQIKEFKGQINALLNRLESLESRISSMSDKLDTTKSSVDAFMANQKPVPTRVQSHAHLQGGVPVEPETAPSDPEAGFVNDAAVKHYRKAMILFRAQRMSDALLAFSGFLEKYPDHPLAGSAQFHIGECYFNQREYKLAVQEFQRVLTSYDRSGHIAQTLRQMADAEDQIRKTEDAARHRQLLMSLFPHSPFAYHQTAVTKVETPTASSENNPAPAAPAQRNTAPAATASAAPASTAPSTQTPGFKLDEPPPTVPIQTEPHGKK